MSLAEIKAELPRLSLAERKELARFLLTFEEWREPADTGVAAATDAVFEKHRELLQRLARS